MVRSYVLATTTAGQALDVLSAVREIEGVREAHVVAGEYDLVVEVDGDDSGNAFQGTVGEIRSAEGIAETRTYVAID